MNGSTAFCLSVFVSITFSCALARDARPGVDLTALELACVDSATTLEASRDCRNAVRRAWAKTNGVDASDLEGGAHGMAEH